MKTLVEAGWVIPSSRPEHVIRNGVVAIDGQRIVAVGTANAVPLDFVPDRVVRAPMSAVLPGLINTHTHLVGGFNKAITEDISGSGLFRRARPLQEQYVTAQNMYYPALVHGIEMLKTGTTTINENWWNQQVSAKVVKDLGLRAILAEMVREVDLSSPKPNSLDRKWDRSLAEQGLEKTAALIEQWHGSENGRILCRVGPHAPDMLSEWGFGQIMDLAQKFDVGVHMHLAQIPGEAEFVRATHGLSPVAYMHRLGVLGARTIGVHCVFLSPEDVELMAQTRTAMSHTALLVAKRGYFPPVELIYGTHVQMTYGSDWCSNDMWEIMRTAILFARVKSGKTAEMITAKDALYYATEGAAIALGIQDAVGTLAAGKKADCIIMDLGHAWFQPVRDQDVITNIVYNGHGSDVSHVWVDGQLLVDQGALTHIDEQAVFAEAQRSAQAVWDAAASLF